MSTRPPAASAGCQRLAAACHREKRIIMLNFIVLQRAITGQNNQRLQKNRLNDGVGIRSYRLSFIFS